MADTRRTKEEVLKDLKKLQHAEDNTPKSEWTPEAWQAHEAQKMRLAKELCTARGTL